LPVFTGVGGKKRSIGGLPFARLTNRRSGMHAEWLAAARCGYRMRESADYHGRVNQAAG